MELVHKATGYIEGDAIVIAEEVTGLNDKAREFATIIFNTRDKLIHEGLLKLGWRPPPPQGSERHVMIEQVRAVLHTTKEGGERALAAKIVDLLHPRAP
jgi:hypothetical protein